MYLLLDMQEETATVFWQPCSQGYVSRLTVPFGEPVRIPAPFGCELDTSGFRAPAAEEADGAGTAGAEGEHMPPRMPAEEEISPPACRCGAPAARS